MQIIFISIGAIIALVAIVGVFSILSHKKGETESPIVVKEGDCTTCSGEDSKCEQECQMEAFTKPIEYFDDEELDKFIGRDADNYTEDELTEFSEVLYTLRPEEVKAWNRSLILRGINFPNQLKDELIALLEQ